MEILDAQLHCWLPDRPTRPWEPTYRATMGKQMLNVLIQSGVPMPPESLLVEMAAAGVDGGVLTPQGVYGNDNSLELETAENYPRKFVVVGWIDHSRGDLEDVLTRDIARGLVGVRLLGISTDTIAAGDYDPILGLCEQHGLSVALFIPHPVPPSWTEVFDRYSTIEFLIDHLGVGLAPPATGLPPQDAWALLPDVLDLAEHPNVSLKLTGAASMSHESYPFRDIWPHVRRIVDTFTPDRVVWGTDITRTGSLHTYAEATHYLREMDTFTEDQLAALYGRSLRRLLKWDGDAYRAKLIGGAV